MGHYKGWTAAALIFGVSEVVLELLMPMLMSAIVDGGLYREDTFMLQGWFSPELIANRNRFVLTVGAIMVGVACLSMAMGVLAARCSAIATQGFARNMRGTLLGKIESFSFANIDKFQTGSLVTRLTNDVTQMQNFVNMLLRMFLRAPGMLVGALIMAISLSPSLAVPMTARSRNTSTKNPSILSSRMRKSLTQSRNSILRRTTVSNTGFSVQVR